MSFCADGSAAGPNIAASKKLCWTQVPKRSLWLSIKGLIEFCEIQSNLCTCSETKPPGCFVYLLKFLYVCVHLEKKYAWIFFTFYKINICA